MSNRGLQRIALAFMMISLPATGSGQSGDESSPLLYDIGSPSMTKTIEPETKPVSKEVAALLRDLESKTVKTRIRAAKIATNTVFNEEVLYRTIEEKLKKGFKIRPDDKYHVDEMSWYCKALAATGKKQYAPILREAAALSPSSKIQRYAQKSLSQISPNTPLPAKTIPVASAPAKNLNDLENQLISKLNSTDLQTVRKTGKQIYRSPKLNSAVYDAVDSKILQLLPQAGSSRLASDTIAWLCKALIISEDKKYIATLNKVMQSSGSIMLKGHAQSAKESLNPPRAVNSFDR